MKSVQVRTRGEGGPKLAILLRTYFMDAPLLGIEIDNEDLTFDTHIAKLCSKAAAQLDRISRLYLFFRKM